MIRFLCAVVLSLLATSVWAAELRPITGADVASGRDFAVRQTDPELFLAAKGDFDGDGADDEARFFANEVDKTFVVRVVWGAPGKPAVVAHTEPLEKILRAALITVEAGDIKHICYDDLSACDESERRIFTLPHPAFAMTHFGGAQVIYSWNGQAFDAYWLAD